MTETDDTVRMEELTWQAFEDRIDDGPVFVPIGSTEQHGPHLPLSVDTVIAIEIAERTAHEAGGMVAPPLHYGYTSQPGSGGGPEFVATTSVHGDTLRRQVGNIVADLARDGVREFVIVNGHFENEYAILEAIDRHLENGLDGRFIIAGWWDLLSASTRGPIFENVSGGFPGWEAEHAGVVETSLMLYLRPDLVDEDAIVDDGSSRNPPYVLKPAPKDTIPDSGVFYKATHATAETGERALTEVVEVLANGIEDEWET
jgi:creatinine amidohydrolase